MVELVARLDVVSSPPSALEERHILIELEVLTCVHLRKTWIERSSARTKRGKKSGRQDLASVIQRLTSRIHVRSNRIHRKVYALCRPTEIVIVGEEITITRSGDDLRGQRDIRAYVKRRVGIGKTEAACVLRDRSVDSGDRPLSNDLAARVGETVCGIRVGQAVSRLPRVLVEPRTEDANLLRDRAVQPEGAEVLLVILVEKLSPKTADCQIRRIRGVAKIHDPGAGGVLRRKTEEEPQPILCDRAAEGEAGLRNLKVILLRLIQLGTDIGSVRSRASAVAQLLARRTVETVCFISPK